MTAKTSDPRDWLQVRPEGLYCAPGDFFIDPQRRVERAVVTHGHADHARPNMVKVLATPETLAIMDIRYGEGAGEAQQALAYGEDLRIGEVTLRLVPAGHILGSAQVVLAHRGTRVVVSGDYKRDADPSCAPFEPVRCDTFITEATFGLPVFRMPDPQDEIARLLHSIEALPEKTHAIGVYGLGKCQRLILMLREAGYDKPIWLHGALEKLCEFYAAQGFALGELRQATAASKAELAGEVVLAPPSAIADRWARRIPDPLVAMASGWMAVRARARQRGVELPLRISDHADWDDLLRTIAETGAERVWVTHGREEALVHQCRQMGLEAEALSLVGFEEDSA